MRRFVLLALVLAISVAGVLATVRATASAGDTTIAWETDLAAATAKAAKSGRPLMVVFR